MIIEGIKQAIKKLSPNDLADFRQWFEKFNELSEKKEHIKKLQGSLKGKGILQALMKEKEFEKDIEDKTPRFSKSRGFYYSCYFCKSAISPF